MQIGFATDHVGYVLDVPIPGAPYTFGIFKLAQAPGDLEALEKHGRRVGRVEIGANINQELTALKVALETV
jgi:hypothetical protein